MQRFILHKDYFEIIVTYKKTEEFTFFFDIDFYEEIRKHSWYIYKTKNIIKLITFINHKNTNVKNILFDNKKITIQFKDGNNKNYRLNNLEIKSKLPSYSQKGNLIILYIGNKTEILIDAEDLEHVKNIVWSIEKNGYVRGYLKGKRILLHRFIMSKYEDIRDYVIDHKNHNKLDNRKQNLRICTISENEYNSGLSNNNTSSYTGVFYDKTNNKWRANIQTNGKRFYLGSFNTLEEAIKIRKIYEDRLFGEYAYKNSIKEPTIC